MVIATLQEFIKLFEPILRWDKEYSEQAVALQKLYPSSYVTPEGGFLLDSYISLLEKYMKDTEQWISYYIWECNLGKNPKEICIDKGNKYIIDSLEKLYGIIVNG